MAKIQYSLNSMRAYVGRTSTLTFQNMEISISNGKSRCKFCLVGIMLGVPTILAYVNNVSPSCVYFIIISRLRKQTSAESEHFNQNQNQKDIPLAWIGIFFCHFYAFDALNVYHCVYYSCITSVLHFFWTSFAPIMRHKISLISCDNRIKLLNIV